jgi:hypothetical protein
MNPDLDGLRELARVFDEKELQPYIDKFSQHQRV